MQSISSDMKKSSNHNTCLKPSNVFFAKNVIFTCILLVICVIPNFAQGAYYLTVSQLESLSYGDQDTKTDGYFVYESRYIQDIDANQDFLFPVTYNNGSWTGSSDYTGSEQHNYNIIPSNSWSEFALQNQLQDLSEPLNGTFSVLCLLLSYKVKLLDENAFKRTRLSYVLFLK